MYAAASTRGHGFRAASRDATAMPRLARARSMRHILTLLFFALFASRGVAETSRSRDFSTGASAVVMKETHEVTGAFDPSTLAARGVRPRDVDVALVMDSGERRTARVRVDGTFALRDVPPGTHRVDVRAIGLTFPPLVVTVRGEDDPEGEAGSVVATYAEDRSVRVETKPLKMTPVSTAEYFEPAPTVSLRALLKNPMFLMFWMMIFAYFAPKLLDAIDPEELQELVGGGDERAQKAPAEARRASSAAASTSNADKVD